MQISAVIPTCNRKERVLSLLAHLNNSTVLPEEVIVVDSGEEKLSAAELAAYQNLNINYLSSKKSVCIQRNIGIGLARSPFIFLCDDDIEVPADYIGQLSQYLAGHPEVGAVSGLVLEKTNGTWKASHPVRSATGLLFRYIFGLGIWGEVESNTSNFMLRWVKKKYVEKGNYIASSGWPVITRFSTPVFSTPVYGLGVSVVKKQWLINSPFDETLDRHGIGDNYGVCVGFPSNVHVLTFVPVRHHHEEKGRLHNTVAYYRRILAMDYFRRIRPELRFVRKTNLLWSLTGNGILFLWQRDFDFFRTTLKLSRKILFNKNPYHAARLANKSVTETFP
jgi:glycosyltransferase involved in cell wall biosynthesis